MPFFEEIGRKITQTGQDAVQKTKAFTEVTRLNAQISDLEKRINNNCLEIGRVYYELHKADPDPDLVPLVESINEAYMQIEQIKVQIQEAKRTTSCQNCGAEMPQGAIFCAVCGTKVENQKENITAMTGGFCSNCGTPVEAGQAFCTNCGMAVNKGI